MLSGKRMLLLMMVSTPTVIGKCIVQIPWNRSGHKDKRSWEVEETKQNLQRDVLVTSLCLFVSPNLLTLLKVVENHLGKILKMLDLREQGHIEFMPEVIWHARGTNRMSEITKERFASITAEVLTDNNSKELHGLRLRCHRICWDNPSSLTKITSNCEFWFGSGPV